MTAPPPGLRPSIVVATPDSALVERLVHETSVSPVVAALLANRGVRTSDEANAFLMGQYDDLLPPESLDEMAEAADLVADAVRRGEKILVHGDYDVDGVTGTALLVWALRELGGLATPYVPHRMDEGYGLSREGIVQAHEDGHTLLVSVDCGSSSPEEIELARSLGMRTVITDHHLVAERPPADAFVNPRAPGSTCSFTDHAGAGVAYQLARAVASRLGQEDPVDALDLAAIGTVGDVMPLVGDNRIIVREGLEAMQGMTRLGLAALMRVADLEPGIRSGERPVTTRSISHALAPRINACGRLDHASLAIDLLLCDEPERALELAREVDRVNTRRREAELAVREEAEARVAARGAGPAIVEGSAGWHQGLVGITAGRLSETYGVPTFVISLLDDGTARGSVRAPAHVNVHACLTECREFFTHYGGHARAGGFTLKNHDVDALRERIHALLPTLGKEPEPTVQVDLRLDLGLVNLDLVEELEVLGPHGAGNPAPLFLAEGCELAFPERFGEQQAHLRFRVRARDGWIACTAFSLGGLMPLIHGNRLHGLVFEVENNVFKGKRQARLIVRHLLDEAGVPLVAPSRAAKARSTTAAPPGMPPATEPAESPALDPAPTAHDESPAPDPAPTAHDESPALDPAPTAHDESPALDPAPTAHDESPALDPAPTAHDESPAPDPAPTAPRASRGDLVDVRTHDNKGRYLADLVEMGRPTLVVVRRGLEAFTRGVVAGGRDLQAPHNLDVRNWAELPVLLAGSDRPRFLGAFAEIALFTPPPTVDALHSLLGTPARCHVVFGQDDLDEEDRLMKSLQVTRETVEGVFRALRSKGPAFGEPQCREVAQALAARTVTADSVRVCVRILCEMGVARRRPDQRYEWTGQRGDLDGSSTYHKYSTLRSAYQGVRELFAAGSDLGGLRHAGLAAPPG